MLYNCIWYELITTIFSFWVPDEVDVVVGVVVRVVVGVVIGFVVEVVAVQVSWLGSGCQICW